MAQRKRAQATKAGSAAELPEPVAPPPWEPSGGMPAIRITDVRAIMTQPDRIKLVVVKIETSNEEFYRLFRQALEDMAALRLPIRGTGHTVFLPAAGLPCAVAPGTLGKPRPPEPLWSCQHFHCRK